MARYQIRTPEKVILEDVIEQMATGAFNVLSAWHAFDMDRVTNNTFQQFRDAIRKAIEPCVYTYKLCGLSNICLDEVKNTPWSYEGHVLDASPTDSVYHLFPGANPPEFLHKLAAGAFEPIEPYVKEEMKQEALSSLRVVFREVLGQYLYDNPVCGKTELCAYSSSAPTKAWQRKR